MKVTGCALQRLRCRWLEDPESDETKAFVAAQNEVSESYLDTPVRKQILKALTKFQDYPKYVRP